MTDNLGPLRQAMSDLAEHGGATDMYERSLHRSRQVQRRNRIATGVGAAVVVCVVAGTIPFLAGNRPDRSAPVATQAPTPSTTPTSEAPSISPSSPDPGATRPSAKPSSKKPSSTPTSDGPKYPNCPSAKTFERIAREAPEDEALPKDWHFPAAGVECWRTWATAEPQGPNRGDGFYLFQYKPGTGWRYHSQGSGYHCQDLGIISGKPPFCGFD
ncbi:hypothetical protein [Actinoplanes sp. NPDC049265]|uniref:hypothetical protein n=1 Tax=Actinoplanes sp. NPDC049265 TaxID=3363902 RepID=UPI0037197E89